MTVIRRYHADDHAEGLRSLLERAVHRGEIPDLPEHEVRRWLQFFTATGEQLAVATDDAAAMVGTILPEPKLIVVEPDHRRQGIGTALVAEGVAIERERGRPNLLAGPRAGDERALAFLRATGFRYHSSVWRLDLPGDVDVPQPSFPAGFTARPFRDGDAAAYVDVFNAAFADHPTPLAGNLETFQMMASQPDFDPSGLLFLTRSETTERIEGFCEAFLQRETEDGPVTEGEVSFIGVRPELQGQGLGRELLRWGVSYLREKQVPKVFLTVNVTNPRALGLYERHGFVRTQEKPRWAKPVEAEDQPNRG